MDQFEPAPDFVAAFARAENVGRRSEEARAVAARYLPGRKMLVVALATGAELHVPTASIEGLAAAEAGDLRVIVISPAGTGLHFPRLDVDLSVPGLVAGATGSRRWMASQPGRAGGVARSERETGAAKTNRRRGGRPRTAERA